MLFNSYPFIFCFLPLVLVGLSVIVRRSENKNMPMAWLVVASLVFYGFWDVRYVMLLMASIVLNCWLGKMVESKQSKKILIVGVGGNLLLLGYYKYAGFALRTMATLLSTPVSYQDNVLPLGISFFTFTQIAYLVDVYRKEVKSHGILQYSLFVTFFPHLIAGPVLYHKYIIPQFACLKKKMFSSWNIAAGVTFFAVGLSKKVLIADMLSPWVKAIFENASNLTFLDAWAGALAYTLQLYLDFSGYSEMAIGLGLLMNIRLPINFNSPYQATSIIDFWRRWHMTLSDFLKRYLYIPLGGNRRGETRRMVNLLATMLLGGLWHGAGWTFVIWGGLHGLFLVINHLWRTVSISLPKWCNWGLTFGAVITAWVFFRAATITEAWRVISTMFGMKGITLDTHYLMHGKYQLLILLALTGAIVFLPNIQTVIRYAEAKPRDEDNAVKSIWRFYAGAITVGFILFISIQKVLQAPASEFLYYQF